MRLYSNTNTLGSSYLSPCTGMPSISRALGWLTFRTWGYIRPYICRCRQTSRQTSRQTKHQKSTWAFLSSDSM